MDLEGMAQRIVEKALGGGAEHAECFAMMVSDTAFSIKRNRLEFGSQHQDLGMGIRVLREGRMGFSYLTSEDEAARAAARALAISTHSKPLAFEPELAFAPKAAIPEAESIFDAAILELEPGDAAEQARQLIDAAEAVDGSLNLSGGAGYGTEVLAIANSNGLCRQSRRTFLSAGMGAIYQGEAASVGYESDSSHLLDLDLEAIGRTAAELALAGRGPRTLDRTDLPVVFHQDALSSMFEFITCPALLGSSFQKGESVYSGRMGEKVCSEALDLSDDALLPNGPNTDVMDDEGIASSCTHLVKSGVLQGAVYDIASSQEFGERRTGSAMRSEQWSTSRSFKAMPKPTIRNLVVGGKGMSREEVIAEVREGIYVYDVLGAHTSNPASGDFSVSVPQLFKIENGEVAHPLKQVMLGGNWPKALESVLAIGNDHRGIHGGLSPVGLYLPTMAVGGIRISQ